MRNKYSLFPIEDMEVWEMYKLAQSIYWTSEEIDYMDDKVSMKKLNENELNFIKHILAFFSTADGIVNENIGWNFINDFDTQEIKCFYGFQVAIENIHSETYSLLLDTYVENKDERMRLQNSIEHIPSIRKKAEFCEKYMDGNVYSLPHRLIAFCIVEGLFFSGAFCSIYWLKSKGHKGGLTFSNELIARDEGLHTKFGCLLYKRQDRLEEEEVYEIFDEALNIEREFIREGIPVNLLGMNSKLMIQYIEFVADVLLDMLGYHKKYNTQNPFIFMEMISMEGKTNFFEARVSEYARTPAKENDFVLDFDF